MSTNQLARIFPEQQVTQTLSKTILAQHWSQDFKNGFDLNNPIFQNMLALQPFYNFSSTMLPENLVYGWTSILKQVETLVLEYFNLPPLFSNFFLQNNDPLKRFYGARVVLAYRMQRCSQLRRLTLTDPEECFIHAPRWCQRQQPGSCTYSPVSRLVSS
jgi:hypothetical protein